MGDMEETPKFSFEAYGRTKKTIVKNSNTQCDAAGRKMASGGPQSVANSRQWPSDKSTNIMHHVRSGKLWAATESG